MVSVAKALACFGARRHLAYLACVHLLRLDFAPLLELTVFPHDVVPCAQNLIEKITRSKIYDMPYWKERCFGVSAEALVDLAMELRCYGGIYGGNNKATDFLCLTLKMLQIQPDKEIVIEFIKNEDYKYVRLLGAFYLRLVGKPLDVYQYLEPLLNDYRKIRHKSPPGKFELRHVDEFINELLTKDHFCDISLPRIPHRQVLEGAGQLEPRRSTLEEEVEHAFDAEAEAAAQAAKEAEAAAEAVAKAAAKSHALPPPPPSVAVKGAQAGEIRRLAPGAGETDARGDIGESRDSGRGQRYDAEGHGYRGEQGRGNNKRRRSRSRSRSRDWGEDGELRDHRRGGGWRDTSPPRGRRRRSRSRSRDRHRR